jgi:hypothetical protein
VRTAGPCLARSSEEDTRRGTDAAPRDVTDLAGYQAFLAEMIALKNAARHEVVAINLAAMGPLPAAIERPISQCTPSALPAPARLAFAITVLSRLVGFSARSTVHVYDDRMVCYLGTTPVLTAERRDYDATAPSGSSTRELSAPGRQPARRHPRKSSGFFEGAK